MDMKSLIKYEANWCVPCKRMTPIVEEVLSEMEGVVLEKVDIDENREKAVENNVRSVPTFVLVEDGVELKRQSGMMTREELKQFIAG